MDRIMSIRRIDIVHIGQIWYIRIKRTDSIEEIRIFENESNFSEKLDALKEFLDVFSLKEKSFMISI